MTASTFKTIYKFNGGGGVRYLNHGFRRTITIDVISLLFLTIYKSSKKYVDCGNREKLQFMFKFDKMTHLLLSRYPDIFQVAECIEVTPSSLVKVWYETN